MSPVCTGLREILNDMHEASRGLSAAAELLVLFNCLVTLAALALYFVVSSCSRLRSVNDGNHPRQ